MSRRYVVTGDRGFVGAALRKRLLAEGHEVIGIGRSPVPQAQPGSYKGWVLDLADAAAVGQHADAIRSCDAVFHLAAQLPAGDDDRLEPHLAGNLRTTENLLEVLAASGTPLVLSSTMSVFGLPPESLPVDETALPQPVEAYGLTKLAAEHAAEFYAEQGKVRSIVLRYPGIFGLRYEYGAIHYYCSRAIAGETVSVYGRGQIVRDYVHVDDVVEANLLAVDALLKDAARSSSFSRYHIGGGQPAALVEIARLVVEAVGHGNVETNERPGPCNFAFDIARARAELGYAPRPLKERVEQYVQELQQEGAFAERAQQ